jgi:hypothetical protein
VITASAVERLLACPASGALPHAEHADAYADTGTANHAEVEAGIAKGDLSVLPEQLRELLTGMDVRAEVAVAYDVATGEARELGQGISRRYGELAPFELAGTADLVAIGNGKLVIADGKLHAEVEHPSRNPQLLTLAQAFSRLYDIADVTLAIFHLDGSDRVRIATVDVFDLESHAAALHELHLTVIKAQRDPGAYIKEGKHCRHCPSFAACPAKSKLVTSIQTGAADNQVEMLLPLADDETAAHAYEFASRVRQLLKRLDAAIYARAADRPIPLTSGMMLGKVSAPGNEKLDGDVVYGVVKEEFGPEVADAAVTRSATKSRLKEALAFVGGKGQVAALERRVLEAVRAKGGSKREMRETVEEYDPRKQLAGGTK